MISGCLKALPVQGIRHCKPDQNQAEQSPETVFKQAASEV